MRNPNRAIIWDMDGVLVDSGDLHYETWRDTLAEAFGLNVSREAFDATFGMDNFGVLKTLLGRSLSEAEAQQLVERKEAAYRRRAAESVRPAPAALDLVRTLKAQGWKQAVATSSPRANLALISRLLGLERWMDALVCFEDVGRGKPDPALFLLAAERMGVPPAYCVVIEDAPAGIAAARAAGMVSVAVTTTHAASALAQANRVVHSLSEIAPQDLEALLNHGER